MSIRHALYPYVENVLDAFFRFDKSATPRNAVNDRSIFRCICLDISDSEARWYCSVKFLLSSPFECSYSEAVLFIVDIVCRLHNSSVCLERHVSHIGERRKRNLRGRSMRREETLVLKLDVPSPFSPTGQGSPEDQKITIYRYRRGKIQRHRAQRQQNADT